MRHDIKIKRVVAKYGLEGYGLYNLALESITESLSTGSPLPDLQETCEDIAEFYNGNTAKINDIMNFMINQGLFELDELSGRILCNKLYKFLDTSQTRSTELRAMIKGFKRVSAPKIEDKSNTVSDGNGQSEIVCEETERKEEEEEENKKQKKKRKEPKHKHGEYNHVLLTENEYIKLLAEYTNAEDMITNLDEYIETSGKTYKNHNLVMRKWDKNKPTPKIDNHKRGKRNFEI